MMPPDTTSASPAQNQPTPGETAPKPRSTAATMVQILRWARPAVPRLILGGIAALGASLLALAIPQVLRVVVNGPLLTSESRTGVIQAALLVLGLGCLEALLAWSRRVFIATPATTVEHDMRTDLFDHLLDQPSSFHDRWAGGQLLQRSMGDLSSIRRWVAFGLVMLIVSTVTIVVGVVLMVTTAWQLGLIYLAGAIPMVWLGFTFRTDYARAARRARDQAGDLAGTVEESVHGIRVLKAFGRGEDALGDFARQADELRETEVHKARTLARVSLAVTAIPEGTLALGLGVGIWLVTQDALSVGALVGFMATAAVVNRPLENIGQLLATTLDARAAADRYLEVIDLPNAVADPAAPRPVGTPGPAGSTVELRDVRVVLGHRTVLDGVDLTLPAGRTTALVGLTGSGKSTLLQLIPRLMDVDEGSVLVDGVDVREVRRGDLRRVVSPAFEDPVLFSASVRENVLLGLEAPTSPAEEAEQTALMQRALDAAQAGFVARLPQGVDTGVGEEGMSLSGGQRQRLALARAIAAKPRVLVMDDPLSAVDVATETAATDALKELLPGTTTLVVAHRPSTVALADQVAVLQDGRISAVGTHEELLRSHAHYRYVISDMEHPPDAAEPGQDAPTPAPTPVPEGVGR
ncbi:ATP-binding cassette subfamily B protein [Serinibacter salmoneus]|uniref:ATP-binding cassette subfamily B protein n=2 Tax=Serinibacter salmoneus TaxID=556530 RepID=A0A2A9D0A8_9MICO|nr:ATP-binding cassette subfamily B protein [Serinibacter salmoneus]